MTLIADPLFYVFAVPAVVILGISKGGFSGIGMVATPLLALVMPPLQAAAILLPIILLQDVLSCWIYRREWDSWNLKVMLPGAVVGVGAAWLFAAYMSEAMILLVVGLIALALVAHTWWFRHGRRAARQGEIRRQRAERFNLRIRLFAPPHLRRAVGHRARLSRHARHGDLIPQP